MKSTIKIVDLEVDVRRLRLRPDDIVVFRFAQKLTRDETAVVERVARRAFPAPRRILIFTDGASLKVLEPEPPS